MNTKELLVDVLVGLVQSVTEEPKRVLFRGVADLYEPFLERAQADNPEWVVLKTAPGVDVVGARNNRGIQVLVVFYREEVGERESLNAFRVFNEADVASALVARAADGGLGVTFSPGARDRVQSILRLVYPSAEDLANFLLRGESQMGDALPFVGLFRDPDLPVTLALPRWQARVQENYEAAVLRWREFLEKGVRSQASQRLLGNRVALLRQAAEEPSARAPVLTQVSLAEALRVLNPPNRVVGRLLQLPEWTHDRAEAFYADVRAGRVDPYEPPAGTPPLPRDVVDLLDRIRPKTDDDENTVESGEAAAPRLRFCLQALLTLAAQDDSLPQRLRLTRPESEDQEFADLVRDPDTGRWSVAFSDEGARRLSTLASGASELAFALYRPGESERAVLRFSLDYLAGRLTSHEECWPDEEAWNRAEGIDPAHAPAWRALRQATARLQEIVDPEWRTAQDERESNNAIYQVFDLLYLAHRDAFEEFLQAWVTVARVPWRNLRPDHRLAWRHSVQEVLLRLGLAKGDGSLAVLPYHPLRLAWHRTIFSQIEGWLTQRVESGRPLVFDDDVLSQQCECIDRPRALFDPCATDADERSTRWMEASRAPFFSLFVPEKEHRRSRAPLDRADQKMQQFGRMWPFSLSRLHIAFQPGDAAGDVYRVVANRAEHEPETAFRIRAVTESAGEVTQFDGYLAAGDDTTDLLTQEFQESLFPRLDYARGQLDAADGAPAEVEAHLAVLVDAFREEEWGFQQVVGHLGIPHWQRFHQVANQDGPEATDELLKVNPSAPPCHHGPVEGDQGRRDVVYVPMGDDRPEFLRFLYDSLTAWSIRGEFGEGVYYERVRWDARALAELHRRADWVLLFDRSLDKSLFRGLASKDVQLIDFHPGLRGGYRLSVSSSRTHAVAWQLMQVLDQFFGSSDLDRRRVADHMLETLVQFASGLLLKTLGGGSLAQELLGLYATYRALVAQGHFRPGQDWLVPLDDYQGWFGRRAQNGRRADLLVLRTPSPLRLEMLAVESKWYKQLVSQGFVRDEFGPGGQMRTTVRGLRSLFDPSQIRPDRDYWQRILSELLSEAPGAWDGFRGNLGGNEWELHVDGVVYVHHYAEHDSAGLAARARDLSLAVEDIVSSGEPDFPPNAPTGGRLRLLSHPELVQLLGR